jgi:hypothetical protein
VGIFFPQRVPLGLDEHAYSATVLERIVTAGTQVKSFTTAERVLGVLAELHSLTGNPYRYRPRESKRRAA